MEHQSRTRLRIHGTAAWRGPVLGIEAGESTKKRKRLHHIRCVKLAEQGRDQPKHTCVCDRRGWMNPSSSPVSPENVTLCNFSFLGLYSSHRPTVAFNRGPKVFAQVLSLTAASRGSLLYIQHHQKEKLKKVPSRVLI